MTKKKNLDLGQRPTIHSRKSSAFILSIRKGTKNPLFFGFFINILSFIIFVSNTDFLFQLWINLIYLTDYPEENQNFVKDFKTKTQLTFNIFSSTMAGPWTFYIILRALISPVDFITGMCMKHE